MEHKVWALIMPTVGSVTPVATTVTGATANITAAKAVGIDAFQADAFASPEILIPLLTAADSIGGFEIGYQLDLTILEQHGVDQATAITQTAQAVKRWLTLGDSFASVAREHGKPVIWLYGGYPFTSNQWIQISNIACHGLVFWVSRRLTMPVLPVWSFIDGIQPTITTLMPQYTRASMPNLDAPFDDGVRYTKQWDNAIAAKAEVINITSWNDGGDGTDIAGHAVLMDITKMKVEKWKKLWVGTAATNPPG